MIYFADNARYVNGDTSNLTTIMERTFGCPPTAYPTVDVNYGPINEGLFRVLTMFSSDISNKFHKYGILGEGIQNMKYCIFGQYGRYSNGGSGYNGCYNHWCWGQQAEADLFGLHCDAAPISTDETNGFRYSRSIFNHDVKYHVESYTNQINEPIWGWTIDSTGQKWGVPQIRHTHSGVVNITLSTFGLSMEPDVIGTNEWKKSQVEINTPNSSVSNPSEIAAGAYNEMTASEKLRYYNQISGYSKQFSNNDFFKLDIIETTTGGFSIGVSTSYISNFGDLSNIYGQNTHGSINEFDFWRTNNMKTQFASSWNPPVSGDGAEEQEYVIPIIFTQFTDSQTDAAFGVGDAFSSNINSTNSIIALAKSYVNQSSYYNKGLSVYTLNNFSNLVLSNAIDLRNISTSGAKEGKTIVNNGDIIGMAMGKLYVISIAQLDTYISPAVSTN